METPVPRRNITTRAIRKGDPIPEDRDWEKMSIEDRINAVWDLTLLCLAWNGNAESEPEFQRSVSRVIRRQR